MSETGGVLKDGECSIDLAIEGFRIHSVEW
jgi:hypothetical protein